MARADTILEYQPTWFGFMATYFSLRTVVGMVSWRPHLGFKSMAFIFFLFSFECLHVQFIVSFKYSCSLLIGYNTNMLCQVLPLKVYLSLCLAGMYFAASMILVGLSLVLAICVLNVHHRGDVAGIPLPAWLRKLLLEICPSRQQRRMSCASIKLNTTLPVCWIQTWLVNAHVVHKRVPCWKDTII